MPNEELGAECRMPNDRAAALAAAAFEVDGFLRDLDAAIQAVGGCRGQAEVLRPLLERWAQNGIRLALQGNPGFPPAGEPGDR